MQGERWASLFLFCFLKEFEFYKVKQKNIKYKILF